MPIPAPKRRWLTFSLRTFLVVTLALSLVLGLFGRAWWKAYRDSQPPTLHELARLAKRHGIPMPPQEAKLVLARPKWPYNNLGIAPQYSPAFLLEERGHGEAVVLRGGQEAALSPIVGAGAPWLDFAASSSPAPSAGSVFECCNSSAIVCAIQLAERGDDDRAAAILQRAREEGLPLWDCPLPATDGSFPDLREFVRYYAFLILEKRLQHEPEAWPEIRERMTALLEESPWLRQQRTALVNDLAAAVDAPAAKVGSVEALLLKWSRRSNTRSETDPAAQEILRPGFESVPELIALRDDQRLTTHVKYEGFSGIEEFLRLGDLADSLLMEISGFQRGEAFSVVGVDELEDLTTAQWEEWWQQAQAQGEREYCLSNLLSADGSVREGLMRILTHKHAEVLPTLGREYLRACPRPVGTPRLASALSFSDVPRGDKVAMLADLAQVGTPDDKRGVLKVLLGLDRERAIEMFVQLFDDIVAEDRDFDFPSPKETFPYLVVQLNDKRLTKAYLGAARRNTPLRMELLSRLVHLHTVYERSTLRLALLAAFLDDQSLRERKSEYERFIPDDFAELTVGDFAASQLARVFKLGLRPRIDWSPEQWATLRAQVRQRLAEKELPELE